MDGGKFSAMLSVIVPPVVGLISTREGMSEAAATDLFYRWHYSAETLYSMYKDEISGQEIEYPEEAY